MVSYRLSVTRRSRRVGSRSVPMSLDRCGSGSRRLEVKASKIHWYRASDSTVCNDKTKMVSRHRTAHACYVNV